MGVGSGAGAMGVQSIGEMGKDFCQKPSPTSSSKNIDRRSCNDGSRELSPKFNNPLRIGRPSPPAVARALEYLVEVPSKAASGGRQENQVRINTQETHEYLECGD